MQQQIIQNVDPSTLVTFAFVCDGEVAFTIKVPQQNEHFLAVLQSNPIVVECTKEQEVHIGDKYVDGKIVPQ